MLAEQYVHGKPASRGGVDGNQIRGAPIGENSALSHPFCVLPPRHRGYG